VGAHPLFVFTLARREKALSRQVTETVKKIILPILQPEGLELVGIEYKKKGKHWVLCVLIDRKGEDVSVDDCSWVSAQLSSLLDIVDPIPEAYFLEVASPGVERPLKKEVDYRKAVGKYVHVTTYEPITGQKVFEGVLTHFVDNILTVQEKKKTTQIPLQKVCEARLAVVFHEKGGR
jgi:ribosome maturation factor RimP